MPSNTQLFEGLRRGDLEGLISPKFTIDHYSSKMGEDRDVIVVEFSATNRMPATDLMEFLEKGYPFVLDADTSAGEEADGKYRVFVEFDRTNKFPDQLQEVLEGMTYLCDQKDWSFHYQKGGRYSEFSEDSVSAAVPLSPTEYDTRLLEFKSRDVAAVLGNEEVSVNESNEVKFSNSGVQPCSYTLLAVGKYDDLCKMMPKQADITDLLEAKSVYLTKYFGGYGYDVGTCDDQVLISRGDDAVLLRKNW